MAAELLGTIELSWGSAEPTNGPGALVVILLIAAVLCIVLGHLAAPVLGRRKNIASQSVLLQTAAPEAVQVHHHRNHLFLPKGADKRIAVRRGGEPVPVWVAESSDPKRALDGTVVDRSRGGLLLAVDEGAEVGSLRYVRAYHAPEELGWVPLEVRHCRKQNERWLLGCKFTQELPWNIILMFG
jgi:hypothetical protein